MRQTLSAYIHLIIQVLLLAVVALTPLIFSSLTTDYIETPKLIFLASITLLLIILWTFSWVIEGRVLVTRTPFDIPLLLLLGIMVVSTLFANPRYISVWGNFPRVHGSLISWVIYTLIYFVAVSNIKTQAQVKAMLYALLGSSLVIAVLSLLSYFNVFPLPFVYAKSAVFNLTGSSFASSALLILTLPLLILSILKPGRFLSPIIASVLLTLFLVTIVLIGNLAAFVGVVVALALPFLIYKSSGFRKNLLILLVLPVVVTVVVAAVGALNIGKANPLANLRNNYPREVQLPITASWDISGKSFVQNPFLGSGPATYLFNFNANKPLSLNSTNLWNIKFDNAFNEYLQVLGTLGGLGFASLIFLTIVILGFSWKALNLSQNLSYESPNNIPAAVAMSAVLAVVLLIFHTTTLVTIVATLLILALLAASHKSTNKVEEVSLGIKASRLHDSNLIVGDILPIIILLPILLLLVPFLAWNGGKAVLADYNHRLALTAAASNKPLSYDCLTPNPKTPQSNGVVAYNCLTKARNLNPYIDLYRTDLAQTNFALANAIAAAKGPTEASPSGSLTDTDKQTIQQLLSQSITEARAATVISPKNSQNWEILASIYRQISGVAENALTFAVDSYGQAIANDPLNPLLRLNAGGVYYSVKNYDMAVRLFSDTVQLKPDFANGYYNLSVALRDKGDLQNAQLTAEKVLSLLDPKSPDYKTASEYLSDLKARIATGSAQQSQIKAPAAKETSALEKSSAPNVPLKQLEQAPEKIATPEAVQK